MTSIISDRLVCGNCVHSIEANMSHHKVRWCAFHNQPVVNHDPCCTSFQWTGQTDSDNRLLRFPRETQVVPFLNA